MDGFPELLPTRLLACKAAVMAKEPSRTMQGDLNMYAMTQSTKQSNGWLLSMLHSTERMHI